jgi:hypothetical protein
MPSTVIAFFHYDAGRKVLRIRFVSGRIYEYLDVPEDIYSGMKEASSKGTYFNQHVKDQFKYRLIK